MIGSGGGGASERGLRCSVKVLSYKSIVTLPIQSKCGEIRTRKTPNMDTFHAVVTKAKVKFKTRKVRK